MALAKGQHYDTCVNLKVPRPKTYGREHSRALSCNHAFSYSSALYNPVELEHIDIPAHAVLLFTTFVSES